MTTKDKLLLTFAVVLLSISNKLMEWSIRLARKAGIRLVMRKELRQIERVDADG